VKPAGTGRYEVETGFTTIATDSAAFSLIIVDENGHYFESAPIVAPEITDFKPALKSIADVTLNGDKYTLFQPENETTPARYVEVCRKLFFDHSRASLLTKAFLEKYADDLSLNQTIIPTGDYWVLDKTFTPKKGTVSYPAGKFTLVISEAATGNFYARCIRPAAN
jgi:hypothetical protein